MKKNLIVDCFAGGGVAAEPAKAAEGSAGGR